MFETAPNILEAIPQLEQDIPAGSFQATPYGLYTAAGAVLLLLLIVAWLLIRRLRRKLPAPLPTAEQLALQSLSDLETEPLSLKAFSLRLSMILREFLTGETQDPALFETHEEFSRRVDALATIPNDCRQDIMNLLEQLAQLKYAAEAERSHTPLRPMIDHARSLVSRIAEAQRQAQAAAAEMAKLKK